MEARKTLKIMAEASLHESESNMATVDANHNDNNVQNITNTSSFTYNSETSSDIQAAKQYHYEKNGSAVHGNIYQLKLLMLFLKRGISRNYSFRLGTEVRQADKFDDLVFEYTQNNKKVYQLLQAKHKLDESKKITAENLLANKTGDYSLVKYFLSYDKCKQNPLFKDGIIKDVIVFTNIDFDFNSLKCARIKIHKVESTDDILDVQSTLKQAARYRFSNGIASLLKTKLGSAVHSLDGIFDFLDHLVFAVNQPNENELEMILKQEIGEVFDFVTTENVYNKLFVRMLNWLQGKEGARFLSYEEGEQFFQEAMKGVPIFFDIKPPVKSFTGRSNKLDDLHNMLQDETKMPQFVCICGLGGVGKTELAKKYVNLYSDTYDNNIVWINADNYESIAESFRRLASDKLNINIKNINGHEKNVLSIVEDTYIFFTKRKTLFVFDNAGKHSSQNKFDGVAEFLPSLPPEENKLHVLITSRNRKWPKHFKVLDLNVFNESEAADFLKNSLNTRNNIEISEIRDLAVLLDCMPLALQQAVSYVNERDANFKNLGLVFTIQDYIDEFEGKKKEHLNFNFTDHSDSSYTKTVFTTWNVTLEMMGQMEHGANALKVLNIASYLAPYNIPTHLFYELLTDPDQLGSAITLLSQYSLINVENGMFSMHRLVQQVIRIKIQEQNLEPQMLVSTFVLLLERHNITIKTIPHALSVWNHSESYNNLVSGFSSILSAISCVLFENERYEDAFDFDEWVLVKLSALLEKGIDVLRSICQTKFNIATLVRQQGKYYIALEILQEVLDTAMDLEYDIEFIATIKINIGHTLLEQGKYNEALVYYEGLYAYEDILGSDHQEILHLKSGIAIALYKKGQSTEALEKLKQLSHIKEKTIGKNHSTTIISKINFATTLRQEQKTDEALELLLETYNVNVKALGNNHRMILKLMENIGGVYVDKNDFNSALQWYNDIIKTEEEIAPGKNDPLVLIVRRCIAEIFSVQGKYDVALEMCRDVLVKQNDILGVQHPDTIRTQCTIGEIYGDQGDYNKAEEILKEMLHKCNITFGNCHNRVLRVLCELTNVLCKQEKFDEASHYIEQALDINIKTYGETHLRTLTKKTKLSVAYYRQNNYDKALEISRKTLDTLQELYPHDSLIQDVKQVIGHTYSKQNRHGDALKILREIQCDREATLGKDHFNTAEIKQSVAEVLVKQRKSVEALKLFQEVHTVYNDVLGSQDPRTLMIHNCIQKSLKLNNDLFTAVRKSNMMIIQRLIAFGADVNSRDNDGGSPLHYAVNNGITPIVNLLLDNGANIMQVTKKGNTSLHIAVSKGSLKVVQVLLQYAKSNDQLSDFVDARTTASGSSALHVAAKNGSIENVKLLLMNGATYNIKDKKNNIPHTVSKNQDITKLLQLTEELFQDAKNGNISITKKLMALTYDTLLAVTNTRDECKTITQVSIVNNHKNIAQLVVQILRDARERCPANIVSRYSGRNTVC